MDRAARDHYRNCVCRALFKSHFIFSLPNLEAEFLSMNLLHTRFEFRLLKERALLFTHSSHQTTLLTI
jgi:hypothetical protein